MSQLMLVNLDTLSARAAFAKSAHDVLDINAAVAVGAFGLKEDSQFGVKRGEKVVKCSPQLAEWYSCQRSAHLSDGNRINVCTDHACVETDRLVQGCATSHHWVKNNFSFQTTRCVVVATINIGYELFQDSAESRTTTPRPPLVEVCIGTEKMLVECLGPRETAGELLRKVIINRQRMFGKGSPHQLIEG